MLSAAEYFAAHQIVDGNSDDTHARLYSAVPGAGVRFAVDDITKPWWKVVEAGPSWLVDESSDEAIERYLGQKYDWPGILGIGLNTGQHDDNDKFCSEVCTLILQSAGLFRGLDSWRVSPGALYGMVAAKRAAA